jgi:hypothetical protein
MSGAPHRRQKCRRTSLPAPHVEQNVPTSFTSGTIAGTTRGGGGGATGASSGCRACGVSGGGAGASGRRAVGRPVVTCGCVVVVAATDAGGTQAPGCGLGGWPPSMATRFFTWSMND